MCPRNLDVHDHSLLPHPCRIVSRMIAPALHLAVIVRLRRKVAALDKVEQDCRAEASGERESEAAGGLQCLLTWTVWDEVDGRLEGAPKFECRER